MVFIKLRAPHTPIKDFIMGIKKATQMPYYRVRRAFAGTKIARNPELSLSKQEISKAIARFQRKTERNITKEEQKTLEDFLNKRYKVQKKEQMKKNIKREREREKEARGQQIKKALKAEGTATKENSDESPIHVNITEYSLPKQQHEKLRHSSLVQNSTPESQNTFQQRSPSTKPNAPTPQRSHEEPEDLPID